MFGYDIMFNIVFFIIISVFVVTAIRGLITWTKNNNSPRLTVEATVVTKRTSVTHHHSNDMHSSSSTSYYVTFQVESGDRIEFAVRGQDYGMLAQGDRGKLSFQGTRYQGFERI